MHSDSRSSALRFLTPILALVACGGRSAGQDVVSERAALSGHSGDVQNFGTNPGNLKMTLYMPAGLPQPTALVVAMHGCLGSAAIFDHASGWMALADRYKFAVVFPSADGNLRCFNVQVPDDQLRDHPGDATSTGRCSKGCLRRVVSRMESRALVLGGGGITGIAWELGMLAGLAEGGVDLREADLIVGTSAGSVVGAQVAAGVDLEERYQSELQDPRDEKLASLGPSALLRFALAMLRSRTPQSFRQRLGRIALEAATVSQEERLQIIASRLPIKSWPHRALKITAVDTTTGELRVFDRSGQVSLLNAVAASCAVPGVWPAVPLEGRHYMDGGVRSATNADLASGYKRIVVLAPFSRELGPLKGIKTEAAELSASAKVTVVTPDKAARVAFGRNVFDPSRRAGSARAGRRQAAEVLDRIRADWSV